MWQLKTTHRGPLFLSDTLIENAGLLVGGGVPKFAKSAHLSMGWGGFFKGDDTYKYFEMLTYGKHGVKDFVAAADKMGKNGYKGFTVNLVLADTDGDIGFMLLNPAVNRKDKTPFIGCRVLDGTVSSYDWVPENDSLLPLDQLPRSINPKRGYICTANGRQVPLNASNDSGASQMITTRQERINIVLS